MNHRIYTQLFNLTIITIIFLCGCGQIVPRVFTINMIAHSSEGQSLTYQSEKQILISRKKFYNIGIYPISNLVKPYERASFYVEIYNKSDENLNFSYDNIKVYSGDRSIKVFTYEESLMYRGKVLFPSTCTPDLRGMSAEQVYKFMELDNQRERLWQEQLNREFPIQLRIEALKKYASELLRRQTVPPEGRHGGIFEIEYPSGGDILKIEVITPDETHKFIFKLQKR